MKLKYEFEIVDMGDEFVAVPVGKKANQLGGVLKLNKTGVEILDCLSKDITEDGLISFLSDKYDNSIESIENIVHDTIKEFRKLELILEN